VINPSEKLSREDYARAEGFLPWNLKKLVSAGEIKPIWLKDQERCWYLRSAPEGTQFVLVDAAKGKRQPAFDHQKLASALSIASGKPCTHDQLPFDTIEWSENKICLHFNAHGKKWEYDLEKGTCMALPEVKLPLPTELLSPDRKWAVFLKNYNLILRNTENGETRPLTKDGKRHYDYASSPESNTMFIMLQQRGIPLPPMAIWSPDSRRLLTQRLDQRRG